MERRTLVQNAGWVAFALATAAFCGGWTKPVDKAVEAARTDEYRVLGAEQVLLVKDFILEDSRLASGAAGVRNVDVPSPVAGYIGRIDALNGVVDVLDQVGGEVIARARHLKPISVQVGDTVEYGQTLGTQHRQGLPANAGKHVHLEVDTRYYQYYENYRADLVSGRLSIDPDRRTRGIEPLPILDDQTIRIGDSADIVRLVQQRLNAAGFRDSGGGPLAEDGIYRLSMQPAVINYQQAQGLSLTGDIDPATLQQIAPRIWPLEVNGPEVRGERLRPPPYRDVHGAPPRKDRENVRGDDPMLQQAETAVRRLDAGLGRQYDDHSACMAASAACLAKGSGLSRVDHIVLSEGSSIAGKGESLFVVQGALDDPANRWAHMKTAVAVATPVAESVQRMNQAGLDRASPGEMAQQEIQHHARTV